jgi:hypothetical protein
MANVKLRGAALAAAFIGIGYAAFLVWDYVSYDDDGRQAVVDQHVANIKSVGQPAGLIVGGSNGYFSLSAAQLAAQRRERWYNASIINAGFTEQNFRSFVGKLAQSMDPRQVKTIVYSSPDFYYRGAISARTSTDVSISGRKPFNLRPYLSMASNAKGALVPPERDHEYPVPNAYGDLDFNSFQCQLNTHPPRREPENPQVAVEALVRSLRHLHQQFPQATLVVAMPSWYFTSPQVQSEDWAYKAGILAQLKDKLSAVVTGVSFKLVQQPPYKSLDHVCDEPVHANASGREWRTADLLTQMH